MLKKLMVRIEYLSNYIAEDPVSFTLKLINSEGQTELEFDGIKKIERTIEPKKPDTV